MILEGKRYELVEICSEGMQELGSGEHEKDRHWVVNEDFLKSAGSQVCF